MSGLNDQPRQIWHVGFIVDYLEEAMEELTAPLGLTWGEPHEVDQHMGTPTEATVHIKTRVVFSQDLPLAIELIEPTPGTPNVRRGSSAFHHLGYWSDDLESEEQRLGELGLSCIYFRQVDDLRRIMLTEGPMDIILEATNTLSNRPGLEQFYPKNA